MIGIIGAGGHTRSSINLLKYFYSEKDFIILDENFEYGEEINGIKIVSMSEINLCKELFLSIGDNNLRKSFFEKYYDRLIKKNISHNTSYIESNVKMGESNQIYANVYINSNTQIGDNNIINSGAIIEHENFIGNHNHISVGSKVCGRVLIENNCFIGAGATIIDKVSICSNVVIGAGTVVVKDIVNPGTYVGTPARKIK